MGNHLRGSRPHRSWADAARARHRRGASTGGKRWRIERQLAPGAHYLTLRPLPPETGLATALVEFQHSVRSGLLPGARSIALRLVDPQGKVRDRADLVELRKAAAAEAQAGAAPAV